MLLYWRMQMSKKDKRNDVYRNCRRGQETAALKGVLWDQKMQAARRGRAVGGGALSEMWMRKEAGACIAWQHQLSDTRYAESGAG